LSALAAENFATRLAAIWIVWPVAGFRPSRAARSRPVNLPKPAIATSRPAASSPAYFAPGDSFLTTGPVPGRRPVFVTAR
jgi:hypothetical protein